MNQAVAQNVAAMENLNPFDAKDDLVGPAMQRQIEIEALGDLRAGDADSHHQPQEVGQVEELKDEEHSSSPTNVNAVMVECRNSSIGGSFAGGQQNLSASDKLQQRFNEGQPKLLTRHNLRKQREIEERAAAEKKGGKKEL